MAKSYSRKRFSKDPAIVSRVIADKYILVPIRQAVVDMDCIYTMDEVAGCIWELIDGKRTLEEIRDVIVEEFEVDPLEAEADLVEFVQQLELAGAIREA